MNALAVHWDILKQDLRYTARTLRRARGFALTAILIVALGVGANTAAFSLTDFVLFRPLPFPDADRLVTLWQSQGAYSRMELSPLNYHDWKEAATSFERLGTYTNTAANLVGSGEPERLNGAAVSADLFPALGVPAALGRTLGGGEDIVVSDSGVEGAEPEVVISDPLWRRVFGADAGIVGRKVTLNDHAYTVIGVMPPTFSFPTRKTAFWIPLVTNKGDYLEFRGGEIRTVGIAEKSLRSRPREGQTEKHHRARWFKRVIPPTVS